MWSDQLGLLPLRRCLRGRRATFSKDRPPDAGDWFETCADFQSARTHRFDLRTHRAGACADLINLRAVGTRGRLRKLQTSCRAIFSDAITTDCATIVLGPDDFSVSAFQLFSVSLVSDAVITVEGLGKKYRLGAGRSNERYTALRDVIAQKAAAPFRAMRRKVGNRKENAANGAVSALSTSDFLPSTSSSEFWALKDVSFEVQRGEVLGIIGRNGAGKSTLLKILSRITEPTEGRIKIKGRVASLLEIGTGFHPELTGRENIFLNGAILGMSRVEIRSKFDEIVAFAEIEKFLDTPVKRYSSGMYVRLAFSVAAHLEPEILVVDEVLAVGDTQFQRKCLGKMQQFASGQGRTVLFVSHNMAAVATLCGRGVYLDRGKIECSGSAKETINRYSSQSLDKISAAERRWDDDTAPGDVCKLLYIGIVQSGSVTEVVDITKPFTIRVMTFRSGTELPIQLGLRVADAEGSTILQTSDLYCNGSIGSRTGTVIQSCEVPAFALNIGAYSLHVAADIPNIRVVFDIHSVLSWTNESSCPVMARYDPSAWKGVLGPGMVRWACD